MKPKIWLHASLYFKLNLMGLAAMWNKDVVKLINHFIFINLILAEGKNIDL